MGFSFHFDNVKPTVQNSSNSYIWQMIVQHGTIKFGPSKSGSSEFGTRSKKVLRQLSCERMTQTRSRYTVREHDNQSIC